MQSNEVEQEDKSYQLYGDGTMLVRVDGQLQRRKYSKGFADGIPDQIVPETHTGEMVCRDVDANLIWIATIDGPHLLDVGFGKEEIHPLARLAQLSEAIKGATQFNQLRGPASTVHAFAHEISELVAQLSQQAMAGNQTLTVKVDTAEVQVQIDKWRDRLHSALHSAQEVGWRAYLDAPMHRDMGRSKFNHGVKAAFEYVIDKVLKD